MAEFTSTRFTGNVELGKVLNGTLRLGAVGTPEYPAPVRSSGDDVRKVQQALIDIGYPMPQFGPDGDFGDETGKAVAQFKKDWHLTPRDPVVGPKTMAALDKEISALERTAPIPPPPPPPPPLPDAFGRTASGLARVPGALATVGAFAQAAGTPWIHLSRATVAAGIAERVTTPDGAQQGGNGLCTTAAFVNVWAQDAPDAYAAFATALFNNGLANIAPHQNGGGQRIQASHALLTADYAALVAKMQQKGFPAPSQADWMVLAAIRDGTNLFFDFTGDLDSLVSDWLADGASPFGDLDGWLRNAGAWSLVVDEANLRLTASLAQAKQLDPASSRCLLNIDVGMLRDDSGRHTVVLRSPITETNDGSVTLKVWTWAGVRDVRVTKAKFEDTYFGANIASL
jgi:peptidoglycan hydrolase-like protein with peptidoglycan-binding domain